MLISFFGYLFLVVGFLVLALPLMIVELSRQRDWIMGGICLFLGLFLLVENDVLRGLINLFVVSITILFGKMMSEIIQTRWNQLSFDEKKRIGSFDRWFDSFKQLGQIFALLGNGCLKYLKSLSTQSDKPLKEKKWVHPELKEEIIKKAVDQNDSSDNNKIRNQELTENEETS